MQKVVEAYTRKPPKRETVDGVDDGTPRVGSERKGNPNARPHWREAGESELDSRCRKIDGHHEVRDSICGRIDGEGQESIARNRHNDVGEREAGRFGTVRVLKQGNVVQRCRDCDQTGQEHQRQHRQEQAERDAVGFHLWRIS